MRHLSLKYPARDITSLITDISESLIRMDGAYKEVMELDRTMTARVGYARNRAVNVLEDRLWADSRQHRKAQQSDSAWLITLLQHIRPAGGTGGGDLGRPRADKTTLGSVADQANSVLDFGTKFHVFRDRACRSTELPADEGLEGCKRGAQDIYIPSARV